MANTSRQPGERWIFNNGVGKHFICESRSNNVAVVIYVYPDNDGTRYIGYMIEDPSWEDSSLAYINGYWKHLPGQQAQSN